MKKVLLGLLALSAVTMAKPSDLTQTPAAGGTVFEATQEGAIGMTGSLTSTIPTVKYVIYASKDDGATKEDVLQLTDFIVSQDLTKAGFTGINPKVYVKRVVSTGSGETYGELDPQTRVLVGIKRNDYLGLGTNFSNGNFSYSPHQLIAKTELEKIIKNNPVLSDFEVTSSGFLRNKVTQKFYSERRVMLFKQISKGELTIDTNISFGEPSLPLDQVTAIEDGFRAGILLGDVKLAIKIE